MWLWAETSPIHSTIGLTSPWAKDPDQSHQEAEAWEGWLSPAGQSWTGHHNQAKNRTLQAETAHVPKAEDRSHPLLPVWSTWADSEPHVLTVHSLTSWDGQHGLKLWGCLGELQRTFQFVSSLGLQVWWRSKRRRLPKCLHIPEKNTSNYCLHKCDYDDPETTPLITFYTSVYVPDTTSLFYRLQKFVYVPILLISVRACVRACVCVCVCLSILDHSKTARAAVLNPCPPFCLSDSELRPNFYRRRGWTKAEGGRSTQLSSAPFLTNHS